MVIFTNGKQFKVTYLLFGEMGNRSAFRSFLRVQVWLILPPNGKKSGCLRI